jgi:elongation factor 3
MRRLPPIDLLVKYPRLVLNHWRTHRLLVFVINATYPRSFNRSSNHGILSTLHAFAANKKSGYERESSAIALQALATVLGPPAAPLLLPSLPILLDLYMDKGDVVRIAATAASKAILKLFPPESTRIVFRILEDILDKGKWKTKVGALDAMKSFVAPARDAVAAELGQILPKVESTMHDTKQEVRSGSDLGHLRY